MGLNVIVGQNNSGKSTALSVIKELFSNHTEYVFDSMSTHPGRGPRTSLEVSFDQVHQSIYCQERAKGFYVKLLSGLDVAQSDGRRSQFRRRMRLVPSRRAWSDRFNRSGPQNKLQLEEQLYNTQLKQEAQLGYLLVGILRDGQKDEFDEILRRIIPEIADWSIDSVLDQDFISYENSTGQRHALSMLGDGFSSVFRMAYTLHSSQPNDVIVLDEPELSLHPEAQKALYSLLSELAEDRQILLATHSPHMVNWSDLARGARLFRVARDTKGHATVNVLSDSAVKSVLPAVDADIRNRKLFDVLAKEVFFRKRVVFCEGQEDVHYVENYLSVEGKRPLPLFGYGAGGSGMIPKWVDLAVDLNIRVAAIFDADKSAEAATLRRSYPDESRAKIWVLPTDDIRDKRIRDGELRKGIFDRKGIIHEQHRSEFDQMLLEIETWLNADA